MASNILSIGQSALAAAQVGISTTGHNIANASTPGYNRQAVVQGASTPQGFGFGFVGQGTEVSTIKRIYSDFQTTQVRSAQSSSSGLDSYYTQIQQINNLVADASAGLSPALQDFFKGVQGLAANPSNAASRQSVLSSAQALAARFQSLDGSLDEIRQGVNSQITSNVDAINTYAKQISQLNSAIDKAQSSSNGQPANDLLDQRDQLVNDLSKVVQTTVVKQDGGSYNIFIGNGQPLVVGADTFNLAATVSSTDPSRVEVGYQTQNKLVVLGENALSGGALGGLLNFRANTLDQAQNTIGQVATALGMTFNAQHILGQDLNGQPGTPFFNTAVPMVTPNSNNTTTAQIGATISDVGKLTNSDYRVQFDGNNYKVTRLSDGLSTASPSSPLVVDGLTLTMSGTPAAGDEFLVRPTINGAKGFSVAITDTAKIAAATPVRTDVPSTNAGSVKISAGIVDSSYLTAPLSASVSLTYNQAANTLTGFPAGVPVSVTNNGVTTVFPAGTPVGFTSGATISFGGASFTLTGTPADGDKFNVKSNTNGVGDSRNMLLLAGLQTSNTMSNGTTSYQGAYSQLVSQVGNKTRELQVTSAAGASMLSNAVATQQSDSGVNLDEEATNLMRYQQAYQAAGKVMQAANQMFNTLLSLGQ